MGVGLSQTKVIGIFAVRSCWISLGTPNPKSHHGLASSPNRVPARYELVIPVKPTSSSVSIPAIQAAITIAIATRAAVAQPLLTVLVDTTSRPSGPAEKIFRLATSRHCHLVRMPLSRSSLRSVRWFQPFPRNGTRAPMSEGMAGNASSNSVDRNFDSASS